jgi:hypothetical protein
MFTQSTCAVTFAQKPRPYPALLVWVESPIRSIRMVVPGARTAAVAGSNALGGSPWARVRVPAIAAKDRTNAPVRLVFAHVLAHFVIRISSEKIIL